MAQEVYELRMKNISKSFPGVKALDNVSFDVSKGTVHVLVGENGAGKSTLMKILNGIYKPDMGSIEIRGKEVEIQHPQKAAKQGIAMIAQELHFMPELTVEEFFFLGKEPEVFKGWVNWKKMTKDMTALLHEEGLDFTAKTKMRDLSISDIQLIEIIKATTSGAKIIIMDEPTSSISIYETQRLFDKIVRLKAEGCTIIYISHKMEEIFKIGDVITVLRDGMAIDTRPADQFDKKTVIESMVGRTLDNIYPKEQLPIGESYFCVENFSGGKRFHSVSFDVCRGEIVGFAGLVGAGRTEVMRAIVGLDPYDSGQVKLNGKVIRIKNVAHTSKLGIMMATEDRKRYGTILCRSIRENMTHCNLQAVSQASFMKLKKEKCITNEKGRELGVKAPSLDVDVNSLSGGNQQKVVISKLLIAHPKVLIFDEPTRGIDVGAKHEIYKIMTDIARTGVGIVMISSELPELLGMCDRIYVMREHHIVGEFKVEDATQDNIMALATGA